MSLRLFNDQCVPTMVTNFCRSQRHQVTRLREVLPIRSPDPVVIAKAQKMGANLISLNGDFADIVSHPPVNYLGILANQLHNRPENDARVATNLAHRPQRSRLSIS